MSETFECRGESCEFYVLRSAQEIKLAEEGIIDNYTAPASVHRENVISDCTAAGRRLGEVSCGLQAKVDELHVVFGGTNAT